MPVVAVVALRSSSSCSVAASSVVSHRRNRATAAVAAAAAFVTTTTTRPCWTSNRRVAAAAASTTTTTTTTSSTTAPPRPFSRLLSRVHGGFNNNNNNNNNNNSGDNDDDNPSKSRREGQTGWNHNQPDESSDFWRGSGGSSSDRQQPPQQQQQQNKKKPARTLRTGWLHNTESQEKIEAAAQKKQAKGAGSAVVVSTARRRLELAMKQQDRNHRILSPPAFHTSGGGAALSGGPFVVTEHVISVPVVRQQREQQQREQQPYKHGRIDVYFTIVEQVKDEDQRLWLQDLCPMTPSQRASTYVRKTGMQTADSMILYLQGGPGFGAPTPVVGLGLSSADASWAGQALSSMSSSKSCLERVVLMDQRGTGKSTPITKQTLEMNFPDLFLLDQHVDEQQQQQQPTLADLMLTRPEEAAQVSEAVARVTDYFCHFRADNIVQDAEEVKDALLLPPSFVDDENNIEQQDKTKKQENIDSSNPQQQPRPWGACLGQSFGGFCLMTYLSQVEHPPKIALFTGGLAPMLTPTDEVYASLWQRVKIRCLLYYEMYPGDVVVVKRIVQRLLQQQKNAQPVKLPSGGTLTARRFLQLGMSLGSSPSSFAALHALLASAFVTASSNVKTTTIDDNVDNWQFNRAFLKAIDSAQPFDDHPIYYFLHEPCYANGPQHSPINWSAHRQYQDLVEKGTGSQQQSNSEFDYRYTSAALSDDTKPTLFFGEMVFPWMSQDYAELGGVGLTAVAQALASKTDWGPLWDGPRMIKALNDDNGRPKCRAAAVVYYDDFYVDFNASMKVTARGSGPLEKCKVYITNDYQHSGLRDDGAKIFAKLYGMATGTVRTPS
jgi:hypothetical protein